LTTKKITMINLTNILKGILCLVLPLAVTGQNNVGIGTQSPEMKLHITETDSTVLLLENNTLLQNNVSNGIYFKTGNGALPYTGALKTIGLSGSKARLGLFTLTSSGINGLKERLSISDEGLVGIGNTNPQRDLHVTAAREELLLLENSSDLEADTKNAIVFKTGNGTRSYTGAIKTIGKSSSKARLGLFTSAAVTSAGLQERLSILDNGDIGIGTIDPNSKLHITEQTSSLLTLQNSMSLNEDVTSALKFRMGNGNALFHTGAIKTIGESNVAARLGFFTFATQDENNLKERLSISDRGYIGIGSIAPLVNLHVSDAHENLMILENKNNLNVDATAAMYFRTGTTGTSYTGAIKTIGTNANSARLAFFTYATDNTNNLRERLSITDNGNVGIGISAPEAVLHVDGSFMLQDGSQGDGKILTSDATGRTSWQVPATTCNVSIGDTHEGGIVFYVDASGCHGLVAKATDEASPMSWSIGTGATDAIGISIYSGQHNTNKIISKLPPGNALAAQACANLSTNGKTDWYLPSRIELDMMFVNLKLANLGGFANDFYWSSTEVNAVTAWTQNFTNGNQDGLLPFNKTGTTSRVRAIRAF
jgi:hypothetical protein